MKLSGLLLGMVVAAAAATSVTVARADGVSDPTIHISYTTVDPACPPTDSSYTCVNPDTNSYTNPVIVDASSLVNGYIDVSDNFVNSGGASGTEDLTSMFLAILYPLGPPPQIFSCSSTIFANSSSACPVVGNPGCPTEDSSFTCNTPTGEGYLEYYLANGVVAPDVEMTVSVYAPEPSAILLLLVGLFAVFGLALFRKRSSAYQF